MTFEIINSYYSKITQILEDLKQTSNKHYIDRNKGKLFEYIAAIYHKVKLYDDIPVNIKKTLNLPISDYAFNSAGVDLIDTNNKIFYQCKNYPRTKLTPNHLGTFFATCIKHRKNCYTGNISITEQTQTINLNDLDDIKLTVIPDNDCNKIINDAYSFVPEDTGDNIVLRDYQIDVLNLIDKFDNYSFQLPCGTGKSIIIAEYINRHPELKIVVFTPSIYLANEMCKLIKHPVNRIFSDKTTDEKYNHSVVVYNSWKNLQNDYDILFVDEAHHYENNAHRMKSFKVPRKYLFSATLKKPDYIYTFDEAIANKYIVDFNLNIHYVKEVNHQAAADLLNKYLEYQHVIVYCNTKTECIKLTKVLTANNITAKCIHSGMNQRDISANISEFKEGNIRILVNCYIIDEGVDIKNCECAFFYENRNSKVQLIQCIGRTQRLYLCKSHGNFICMCNNDTKDLACQYLNVLSDETFYTNSYNRLKFHNDISTFDEYNDEYTDELIDDELEEYNELEEFERFIIENVYSNEYVLNLCREYYNEFKKLPKSKEIYKEWKIGGFIDRLKRGKNKHIKEQVEKIFNQKIEVTRTITKSIIKIPDEEKIKLCNEFYNEYKKLPKSKEIYKGWNIGEFIRGLKKGCHKHLKLQVENIFHQKIELYKK